MIRLLGSRFVLAAAVFSVAIASSIPAGAQAPLIAATSGGVRLGGLGQAGSGPDAADVMINLYGRIRGWGTSPGAESNPGPTLVVSLGDRVTMGLTGEDAPFSHTFWIDYDADGVVDSATEPVSPEFTSPTAFAFTASVEGTFTYYCTIHSGPPYSPTSSPMRGTWITAVAPAIAIRSPTASSSWSGGFPHDIVFDLAGAEPPGNLTLWLNYSANGGATSGAVAGPILGTTNPNIVPWTPTGFSASDLVIDVTAIDTAGRRGSRTSPGFEVDSAPPAVAATVPSSGATGVARDAQVRVTWSEGMDRTATGSPASFGLLRVVDGVWIAGARSWSTDSTQMTFSATSLLNPLTNYDIHVNATAKDDSDPGNALGAPVVSRFTTGLAPDTVPPAISSVQANPPSQLAGSSVNISAHVTDDLGLGAVSAHIIGPSLDVNVSMNEGPGSTWFVNRTYAGEGTYSFAVWAVDASGNAASRTGSFVVTGVGPPSVAPDPTLWIVGAAVALGAGFVIGFVWWRRRRQ